MQVLPSTCKQWGVDGDGHGVANILDLEDAVPSAGAYHKAGGAPRDWYAALELTTVPHVTFGSFGCGQGLSSAG